MYKYLFLIIFLLPISAHADMNAAMQALNSNDYTRAAAELKPLAEQGNAIAQSHLGYLYYTGEGVPQSFDEAVKWYLKAAVQGNRDAQYNLAVAYAFGEGEKQDYKEAAIWYRRAAEQGHPVAQYSLGLSYAYGEGVKQDDKMAAEWFLKSAEQGYENAQVMVGSLYHTGDGFTKDYSKAVEWYRKAANKGNEIAQYNLGVIYRAGKGVNKNTDEAIKWFRLAADQGYEPAQNELSTMERAMAGAAKQTAPAIEPSTTAPEGTQSVTTASKQKNIELTKSSAPVQKQTTEIAPAEKESTPPVTESSELETQPEIETTQENTVATETDSTENEKSGGIFSRLKNLFKADETTKAPVPEVESQEKQITTTSSTEASISKSEPEPVIEEETIETTPDVTTNKEKKKLFKPVEHTGSIQEMISHHQADTPQIEEQSAPNLVPSSADKEEISPEIEMPEPTVAHSESETSTAAAANDTENTALSNETTNSESGVTTASTAKSVGVFGFFGRMFSSADNKDESDSKKQTKDTIVQEEKNTEESKHEGETYSATSYSADTKKSEQQLTTVPDTTEAPSEKNKETTDSTIIAKTEPVITDLESNESPPEETITIESESTEETSKSASDKEKGGLGSFFGRLFGSDNNEASNPNDSTNEVTSTPTPDKDQVTKPDNTDWNKSLEEPSAKKAEIQTSQSITDEPVDESIQIAKADVKTESMPLDSKAEQEIKTTNANPLDSLQTLAVSGDPTAQYELGNHYYEGSQVKQDFDEAFIWYRRAALQGNADAQYHLGTMYLMGEGIEQNDTEAKNWYEKAADQGNEAAKHNLENLQRMTASTDSQKELQSDTPDNTAAPEEKKKGVLGFMKGLFNSDKNEVEPQQTVTTTDTSKSDAKSKPVEVQLKPPAESDHERGLAYTYGEGVPQNDTTAFKYFQSAALQGYAPAQYELGIAYESGRGTQKDIHAAIEWYEKSAQQGYVMAQRSLGNIYMNGEGISQNKPLALAWYSILAVKGNVLDVHRRDLLKEQLTSEEIKESETLKQQLMSSLSTASTSY